MLDIKSEECKITENNVAEIFNLTYSQVANTDKAMVSDLRDFIL